MFEEVQSAYDRVKGIVNKTPVLTSTTLNKILNANIYVKAESFQKIGAFKFRGAYNAISKLTEEQKEKGVVTHSSGNHAQALSLAAKMLNVRAVIVMPENAPKIKIEATKSYGAEIVFCGSKPQDREEMVKPLIEEKGYTFIHPSNDLDVIYGQGTAAYELIHEIKHLDYIFAPLGGGGLLSGTALATKGLLPDSKVIGVEPKNADDAYRSIRDNTIYPSENPNTIADGLRTSLGDNTFRVIKEKVDKIITVSEDEIVDAMEFYWSRMKIVVEPSGAVALAGVLSKQIEIEGKIVGIIISGGNVDLTSFFETLRMKIK